MCWFPVGKSYTEKPSANYLEQAQKGKFTHFGGLVPQVLTLSKRKPHASECFRSWKYARHYGNNPSIAQIDEISILRKNLGAISTRNHLFLSLFLSVASIEIGRVERRCTFESWQCPGSTSALFALRLENLSPMQEVKQQFHNPSSKRTVCCFRRWFFHIFFLLFCPSNAFLVIVWHFVVHISQERF